MRIEVRNFIGLEHGDVTVEPGRITLVGGLNGSGKSTVSQAAQAVLTNEPLVRDVPYKTNLGWLVLDGSSDGWVRISDAEGNYLSMAFPAGELVSGGDPEKLRASPIAVRGINIPEISVGERTRLLIDRLGVTFQYEDLAEFLADKNVSAIAVGKVWAMIQEHGWDAAHEKITARGAELKGEWRNITGVQYGSKRAPLWVPDGWDIAWDEWSAESAAADVETAKDLVEEALKALGAAKADVDLAATIDTKRKELEAAERHATECQEKFHAAIETDRATPQPSRVSSFPCPCMGFRKDSEGEERAVCAERLKFVTPRPGETQVVRATDDVEPTDAELREARKRKQDAEAEVTKWKGMSTTAQASLAMHRAEFRRADEARSRVHEAGGEASGPEAERHVQSCRDALDVAERRLAAIQKRAKAASYARAIADSAAIAEALLPDGVRRIVLRRRLEEFSKSVIAPLCAQANIGPVTIGADVLVYYNGRPYSIASSGEKWMINAVLQVAFWLGENDRPLLVMDAADVLDMGRRRGLFTMLAQQQVTALVTMTYSQPWLMPNLPAAGGRCYWAHKETKRTQAYDGPFYKDATAKGIAEAAAKAAA